MAERRATNKYYPPDWDPSKGSVNKHANSHPLRHRAKRIEEGIIVIRFAMPFNVWCLGCNNHIGSGVRYNAEKSKIGFYYSSPIYQFRMKCRMCDNHFEIKTNPSKFEYEIVSGCRQQAKAKPEDSKELEQVLVDEEESKRRAQDAMYRLERKTEDQAKGESGVPDLQKLKVWRSRWEDNFTANQIVRKQFRDRRKRIENARAKDKDMLKRMSLRIRLAKPCPEDFAQAKDILAQSIDKRLSRQEASEKRTLLNTRVKIISTPNKNVRTKHNSPHSTSMIDRPIKKDPG